jgi:predicted permease
MSIIGRARMWMRAAASRRRLEGEMHEEMNAHLAQAAERFMARGMSESEARQAAQREFGHLGSIEQSAREARGAQWITSVGEDLRHAMRYFARTPLASITIILTLALGIGFSSAGFSVLDGVVFRPAPGVPDDPALVKIRGRTNMRPYTRKLSWEELNSYAAQTGTFSAVVGWSETSVVIDPRVEDRGVLNAHAIFVTPNYFRILETRLIAGRLFEQSRFDQLSPPELTAIVSHDFARQLDGVDAAAMVGRTITVNGTSVTITGVTTPRFNGPVQSGEARSIWLPLSTWETLTGDRRIFSNPDVAVFEAAARLQPGVTTEQAMPAVRLVASRVRTTAATPDVPGERRFSMGAAGSPGSRLVTADVVRLRGMMTRVQGPYPTELAPEIAVLATIALLILLVCTTTVNSLLLGAATTRRYEIGVRLALGASRWRVVRQLLTEIAILALLGGLLGMYAFGAVIHLVEVGQDGFDVTPNGTTLVFTLLYALITATLCGLSPALHATRTALAEVLKESAVTTTSRSRLQRAFVVAQIAIAQPLMVSLGAALAFLAQDFRASSYAELRERLIVASIDTYSGTNFSRPDPTPGLIERLSALAGVIAVVPRPAPASLQVTRLAAVNGANSVPSVEVEFVSIVPGFLDAVDSPIVFGRDFVAADSLLEVPPVILSDTLARRLFPSGAVGRRVRATVWPDERALELDVIGVARAGIGAAYQFDGDTPMAFAPRRGTRGGALLIRTQGPAEPMLPLVRSIVQLEAPSFPLSRLTTMSMFDAERRGEFRIIGGAGLGSGAIALLLAAVGLYAMLSVAVGQRRREIGVRIAIGARRDQVVELFFMSGLRTALLGVLIGLPFSIVALRLVGTELGMTVGTAARVAIVIMSAVVAVASLASWLPARRAAAVDPSLILRSE